MLVIFRKCRVHVKITFLSGITTVKEISATNLYTVVVLEIRTDSKHVKNARVYASHPAMKVHNVKINIKNKIIVLLFFLFFVFV